MPWIYRYRDLSDNIIKYVGLVYDNSKSALRNRIRQHASDIETEHKDLEHWYLSMEKYEIEVLTPKTVKTKNDAEMLEGHFIALYGTHNYLNKAKSTWGLSSYLSDIDFEWVSYSDIIPSNDIVNKIQSLQKENQELKQEIVKLNSTITALMKDKQLLDVELNHIKEIGTKELMKQRQAEGIARAKERGVYKGRQATQIDEEMFHSMVLDYQAGKRTASSISKEFGITNITFYRWCKKRGYKVRTESPTNI